MKEGACEIVGEFVGNIVLGFWVGAFVSGNGSPTVGEYVGIGVVGAFVNGVGIYVGHLVGTTGAEVPPTSSSPSTS
jgi:hypothetical protein